MNPQQFQQEEDHEDHRDRLSYRLIWSLVIFFLGSFWTGVFVGIWGWAQ